MSDCIIRIIPEEPAFVPTAESIEAAEALLKNMLKSFSDLYWDMHETIDFYDCGEFETVRCDGCGKTMPPAQWHKWMNEDFADDTFRLQSRELGCCGHTTNLHKLKYTPAQGFGRFCIAIYDPDIAEFNKAQKESIAVALGCEIRVITEQI